MGKRKKIKSFFRRFSPILIPFIVLLLSYAIWFFPCLGIPQPDKDKVSLIVGLDGTFIGSLIMVFTIYVSFPLPDIIRKRFMESKHQKIFIGHIWIGMILYILSIFSYLIIDQYLWVMILFLMGMSNFLVTAYYITVLVKYINQSLQGIQQLILYIFLIQGCIVINVNRNRPGKLRREKINDII